MSINADAVTKLTKKGKTFTETTGQKYNGLPY